MFLEPTPTTLPASLMNLGLHTNPRATMLGSSKNSGISKGVVEGEAMA